MIRKTRWLLISIVVIIISLICVYTFYFYESDETYFELDELRYMASNATCSDITNKMFVIDNQFVFWIVEGNCPDASYSYTLFGNSPDEILCKRFDSIAGPQEQCIDESYQEIFQIICDNKDAEDLGLDKNHKITEIEI
jgi:hypothetical protein